MSQRKIRHRKKNKEGKVRDGIVYMSSNYPVIDPITGKIDIRNVTWDVTEDEMSYMPLYQRAHELMPRPQSFIMDFNEYRKELGPSIEILENAKIGTIRETDTILRALGILGHTPDQKSIHALSLFSESSHSLAKVARLALGECASMYADNNVRCVEARMVSGFN